MFRRVKLTSVGVKIPFLNVDTNWTLSQEEQQAAWKLLVELVTRTSVAHLADDDGTDKAALTSLHSLFATTRDLLKEHGLDTGANRCGGGLPFATVAVRILNEVLRPFTSKWHPLLDAHHERRPANVGEGEWEAQSWGGHGGPLHVEFRYELAEVRNRLRTFIFVLSRAAGTTEFGSTVEADAHRSDHIGGHVYAQPERAPAKLEAFTARMRMTRWFSPVELVKSKWLEHEVRKMDDRDERVKEVGGDVLELSGRDEVWFDYVADMGDAFDPTMQVAWTLGRKELSVVGGSSGIGTSGGFAAAGHSEQLTLRRGDLLVLGGDELYPYPVKDGYRNQLCVPYELGFEGHVPPPCHRDEVELVVGASRNGGLAPAGDVDRPLVLALPGNHDWYGGLDPWREVFCASDESDTKLFAGRQVTQKTSWWSAKLPHGWWLWGIDTFVDGSINDKQREYFAEASKKLVDGDQVIVCVPVPLWRLREDKPGELVQIESFVEEYIDDADADAHARVYLSGDFHVFAAHKRTRTNGVVEYHLTSGGGGAFLHPTHNLATVVPQTELGDSTDESAIDPAPFVDGTFWPPPVATYGQSKGIVWQGIKDRQSIGLIVVLAIVSMLYGLAVGLGVWNEQLASGLDGIGDLVAEFTIRWPGFLVSITMFALWRLVAIPLGKPNTKERLVIRSAKRTRWGLAIAQLVASLTVAVGVYWAAWQAGGDEWDGWARVAAPIATGLIGGPVAVAIIIAGLLFVNRRYRVNDNEAFSAHHFVDGKHFLRCHIDTRGHLHIYLVAIEKVRRGWLSALQSGGDEALPPGAPMRHGGDAKRKTRGVRVAKVEWSNEIRRHVQPVHFDRGQNRRVAVSISDPDNATEVDATRLYELFAQLTETLLSAGFEIAYGGDHRRGGYTEQLAEAAKGTIGFRGGRVHNYLAGTEYNKLTEDGFVPGINVIKIDGYESETDPEIRFARELTAMRKKMTEDCLARVVVGGKLVGALGTGPGVLEEAYFSLDAASPLVVLSGFGGVGKLVSEAFAGQVTDDTTDALAADVGYTERQKHIAGSVTPETMLDRMSRDGSASVEVIETANLHRAVQQALTHLRRLTE